MLAPSLIVILCAPLAAWASSRFTIAEPPRPEERHVSQRLSSEEDHYRSGSLASQGRQNLSRLFLTVVDDNGVAVTSARVILTHIETQTIIKGETDYVGRRMFTDLTPGMYQLRVEKEGFYAVIVNDVRVGETESLEITLNRQQEFIEQMDVIYSPPAIDPTKTATSEHLSSREILNLPYPTTRDIRNALSLVPGVLQDTAGQIHVSGSAESQTLHQLDGFNITHPVSGLFDLRVSVDAIRSVEIQSSRYSAEYGKSSGGVLSFLTGMGDDRYRFSATNFIPSFETQKGLNLTNWTPRATFSGPLRKKRAWFYEAATGEYDLNIINELPLGADRSRSWRVSNLAKAQVNVTEAHALTMSVLLDRFRFDHAGLSRFTPLETTLDQRRTASLFTLKDQSSLSNGLLLELGFGANLYRTDDRPMGRLPYVIRPEGTSGNHFLTAESQAARYQWIANLFLPPLQWHGRHELKIGTDIDRITYTQFTERRSMTILRGDGTLARQITFFGSPQFRKSNFELSSFVQDRWSASDRLLMEFGVRLDWDQILRSVLLSPRFASSCLVTRNGDTKLSMGIGLFYDALNLDLITRPLSGRRLDVSYASDGQTPTGPPVEISFHVHEQNLTAPRSLNWSLGLERKLPGLIYLTVEFLQKRGANGLTYVNRSADLSGQLPGLYELTPERRDRCDSLQITARRTLKGNYVILASYMRSAARSNAVLDFTLYNPIFSQQAGGPLPWDAPNRFLSWGWLPFVKGFDFAYSLDWRDGYPFSVIDQDQRIVGPPNSRRFPAYFSLNLHLERRIKLFGFQWALRAGVNNVTGRDNPTVVNNNLDSPQFLTFGGIQHPVLNARIRFLGRK